MVPLLRTKLSTGTSSPTKLAHGFLRNWPRRVHFLTLNAGCAPWLERFEILAHLILRSCCVSMSTCHAQRRKGKPCPAPHGQAALKEPLCKLQDVSHTAHPTSWKRSAGEKKWQHKSKFTGGKKIRASIRDSSNCFYAPCCRWKQKHGLHIRTRCHIRTLECCDIAAGWLQNMSALFMFTMSMYQNTLWLTHRQITCIETRKNISRYSKQSCCHTRNFSLKCVRFFLKHQWPFFHPPSWGDPSWRNFHFNCCFFLRLVMLIFNFRINLACVLSWKPGKHFAIRNWHKRTVCVTN